LPVAQARWHWLSGLLDGLVEQSARRSTSYDRPANLFVACFIGSPAMNFIRRRIEGISAAPAD
jgi:ABC-type sugar transport system ATPase subunit